MQKDHFVIWQLKLIIFLLTKDALFVCVCVLKQVINSAF